MPLRNKGKTNSPSLLCTAAPTPSKQEAFSAFPNECFCSGIPQHLQTACMGILISEGMLMLSEAHPFLFLFLFLSNDSSLERRVNKVMISIP